MRWEVCHHTMFRGQLRLPDDRTLGDEATWEGGSVIMCLALLQQSGDRHVRGGRIFFIIAVALSITHTHWLRVGADFVCRMFQDEETFEVPDRLITFRAQPHQCIVAHMVCIIT